MSEVYKIFSEPDFDFSNKAKEEAYLFESKGIGNFKENIFNNTRPNGYRFGKKMLNITVAMWKKDTHKGLLFLSELYSDIKFPHWWLNKVFNRKKAVKCFP